MTITAKERAVALVALEQLRQLVDAATRNPQDITHEGMQALRAAADHAGREAAASLGLRWDGEPAAAHDRLDWIDLLRYVSDPF